MFEISESTRARHLRISVYPDGRVHVTKPKRESLKATYEFIEEKRGWIERTVEKFKMQAARKTGPQPIILPRPRKNSRAYEEARQAARALVTERLAHFNQAYGFRYGTISIRDQKTRWGSCSAAGNLSFNYRLIYLPPELADYVIVHELCHTREHNHSERFWAQMARTLPDHAQLRKRLRTRFA